jgi:hypothetical protein
VKHTLSMIVHINIGKPVLISDIWNSQSIKKR